MTALAAKQAVLFGATNFRARKWGISQPLPSSVSHQQPTVNKMVNANRVQSACYIGRSQSGGLEGGAAEEDDGAAARRNYERSRRRERRRQTRRAVLHRSRARRQSALIAKSIARAALAACPSSRRAADVAPEGRSDAGSARKILWAELEPQLAQQHKSMRQLLAEHRQDWPKEASTSSREAPSS